MVLCDLGCISTELLCFGLPSLALASTRRTRQAQPTGGRTLGPSGLLLQRVETKVKLLDSFSGPERTNDSLHEGVGGSTFPQNETTGNGGCVKKQIVRVWTVTKPLWYV